MDYCDCGAPLEFSPDGVHCVGCYEVMEGWPRDDDGEALPGPLGAWWCGRCGMWHGGRFCPQADREAYVSGVSYVRYVVVVCCVVEWLVFLLYLLPDLLHYGSLHCMLVGLVDALVCGVMCCWWGRSERRRE